MDSRERPRLNPKLPPDRTHLRKLLLGLDLLPGPFDPTAAAVRTTRRQGNGVVFVDLVRRRRGPTGPTAVRRSRLATRLLAGIALRFLGKRSGLTPALSASFLQTGPQTLVVFFQTPVLFLRPVQLLGQTGHFLSQGGILKTQPGDVFVPLAELLPKASVLRFQPLAPRDQTLAPLLQGFQPPQQGCVGWKGWKTAAGPWSNGACVRRLRTCVSGRNSDNGRGAGSRAGT